MSSKYYEGDLNLDGYFTFQDTGMPPLWEFSGHRKSFRCVSKLPDYQWDDQEAQGFHPPSRIKDT